MKKGECLLCLQQKELIKAHIVPEHLHKFLYSKNHSFSEIPIIGFKKTRRKGIYDPNILCRDCDQIIGQLDSYASNVFWNWSEQKSGAKTYKGHDNSLTWVTFENVDSGRIKLFFISILWRAHISKLDHYKVVDLKENAEPIKMMITENNPLSIDKYPILLIHYSKSNDSSKGVNTNIMVYNHEAKKFYAALMGGLLVIWYMKIDDLPTINFQRFVVAVENKLTFIKAPEGGFEFVRKIIGERDFEIIKSKFQR